MAIGQSISQRFGLIFNNPNTASIDTLEPKTLDCCYSYIALAELGAKTNPLYNDQHSLIAWFNQAYSTADIYLEKLTNGIVTTTTHLTNNTYGTYYAFGFFDSMYGEKAIGYKLDWNAVLNTFGEGDYRLRATGTLVTSGTTNTYSFTFCLKKYLPYRADETVYLEWFMNGNIGSANDDILRNDYGTLNWYNAIRIADSVFGNDTSNYERDYVKYQSGKKVWIKDSQIEEYSLKIGRSPAELHKFIKCKILQADEILITDYSANNPNKHLQRKIILSSNYEPQWNTGTLLASVELKFQQMYQNFTHKRS